MNIRKTIALAGVVFLGFLSLAQGAETRQNRDESLIFIGVSPLGLHLPTFATQPVGLGVYLGDSLLIGVEAGSTTQTYDEDGVEATATYSNSGAYVRWFTGNSFNVFGALHERAWSADAETEIASTISGIPVTIAAQATLDATATVATLGLGNQWIMDFGLVVGMDWLLGSGIIASSSAVSVEAQGEALGQTITLSDAEKAEAEADLQDTADALNAASGLPGLFVLTLGYAF